jgi:hypothetical protein
MIDLCREFEDQVENSQATVNTEAALGMSQLSDSASNLEIANHVD